MQLYNLNNIDEKPSNINSKLGFFTLSEKEIATARSLSVLRGDRPSSGGLSERGEV